MRSFNASFTAEKNKRADGPQPVNLLEFGFTAPLLLSDRDVTPSGGSAYSGLVKSWGFIDSDLGQMSGGSILGSISVPDLALTLINTQSPRISDSFTDDQPLEAAIVTLHQWFGGLAAADKEVLFVGTVTGQPEYDEYECRLTLRGIWQKYNIEIGADRIITQEEYPAADPDDIGQMKAIGYGHVAMAPCRAIKSGGVDLLVGDIDAVQNTIELADATEFPVSGQAGIEEEEISYTGKSGNVLTGCVRGINGTTAAAHVRWTSVWEIAAEFVYQVAGHPVQAIGDIWMLAGRSERYLRVTSTLTRYTGRAGDEHPDFPGQAVVSFPARITKQQAVDLLVSNGLSLDDSIAIVDGIAVVDGITVADTIAVVDSIGVSDTIGVSTGSHGHTGTQATVIWSLDKVVTSAYMYYPANMSDKDMNTAAVRNTLYTYDGTATLGKGFTESYPGPPQQFRLCMFVGLNDANRVCSATFGGHTLSTTDAVVTVYSDWYNVTAGQDTWEEFNLLEADITLTGGSGGYELRVGEFWVEVRYTPTTNASAAAGVAKTGAATKSGSVSKTGSASKSGAASKSGTVSRTGAVTLNGSISLTGNSVADVEVGQLCFADYDGWQDDGSGTYTGTPDALIERPDHILRHLWAYYLGAPLADFDTSSASAYFAEHGYVFSLHLDKPVMAEALFSRLALQCRSRFMVTPYGQAKLLLRQLGAASGHHIIKEEIKSDSMRIARSPAAGLVNDLTIYYDPDRTRGAVSADTCQGAQRYQSASSIARYGRKTGDRNLFTFDAVRAEAMVADLGDFYLAWLKVVRSMPQFAVFLDNMEIEPGDVIDITYPLDAMAGYPCEVLKTQHVLGDRSQVDHLIVWAIENGARE